MLEDNIENIKLQIGERSGIPANWGLYDHPLYIFLLSTPVLITDCPTCPHPLQIVTDQAGFLQPVLKTHSC